MTINSKDFLVREGGDVNLKKWPTLIDPVCKSKEQYSELLEEHVVQLSSMQQLHYATTVTPFSLSFRRWTRWERTVPSGT